MSKQSEWREKKTVLGAIMATLQEGYWSTAVSTEPLKEYIDPNLSDGGKTEDKWFVVDVYQTAKEMKVEIGPLGQWPEKWLKLTATELAKALAPKPEEKKS